MHLSVELNGVILYAQIINLIEASSLLSLDHPNAVSTQAFIILFIQCLILTSLNSRMIFRFAFGMVPLLWMCLYLNMTSVYTLTVLTFATGLQIPLLQWQLPEYAWDGCQTLVKRSHRKNWVVHGISAFLVLSYAMCKGVLQNTIINPAIWRGENASQNL